MTKRVKAFADLGQLFSDKRTEAPDSTAAREGTGAPRKEPMHIVLERQLDVECWRVIGRIAKAAKRAELMPVLLRAREVGGTDTGDLAKHLLFDSSSRRVVAERLLKISEHYGLLQQREPERDYVLTESGHQALASEQVFVPEYGTWTIWASSDPLLATPILRVEPFEEPTAYDEVWGKSRDNARDRPFKRLPPWIRDTVGLVAVPIVGGGTPLRIDHLEMECEVAEPAAELCAVWDVSDSRLRVEGMLDNTPVDTAVEAPQAEINDVWRQLLDSEGLWSHWDPKAGALRVDFEDVAPGERESLVRAVEFQNPKITGLGTFENATVEGVDLRARSKHDANTWAEWRLRARVCDYATDESFSTWTAEAIAPFAEFQPSTPSRKTLADAAWRTPAERLSARAWHLMAAEDWRLG